MKLEQEFDVKAPVETVWATLIDVERVAPCLPGAEITGSEDGVYQGNFQVKIGPTTASYRGQLEMQLIFFRGTNECTAWKWVSSAAELSRIMSKILCRSGYTQIERSLRHVAKEHQRQAVAAVIVVSDSLEEEPSKVYAAARELGGVPVFMFQEGDDAAVAGVYAKIASITKGASCQFDSGSAARLADLLKAVVAFATGGRAALSNQNTAASKLLLSQMK